MPYDHEARFKPSRKATALYVLLAIGAYFLVRPLVDMVFTVSLDDIGQRCISEVPCNTPEGFAEAKRQAEDYMQLVRVIWAGFIAFLVLCGLYCAHVACRREAARQRRSARSVPTMDFTADDIGSDEFYQELFGKH